MEAYVLHLCGWLQVSLFSFFGFRKAGNQKFIYDIMKHCLLLFAALSLSACCITKHRQILKDGSAISNDTTISVTAQDSLTSLFRNAKSIHVYETMPMITDTTDKSKRDSLLGYPLIRSIGKITGKKLEVIKFLMNDESQFVHEYSPVRQPFWPNVIFELRDGKTKTYCMMSFGTHEITFTKDKKSFRYAWMRNSETVERWFDQYTSKKKK